MGFFSFLSNLASKVPFVGGIVSKVADAAGNIASKVSDAIGIGKSVYEGLKSVPVVGDAIQGLASTPLGQAIGGAVDMAGNIAQDVGNVSRQVSASVS